MLRNISQFNLENKVVLLRVDYNVALKKGKVDPFGAWRIQATLETLRYLKSKKARVILLCHRGRPKGKIQESLRLEPIGRFLAKLLNQKFVIIKNLKGFPSFLRPLAHQVYLLSKSRKKIVNIRELGLGELLILENLRFHPGEKKNDPQFVKALASLGDIFINDAFATCHRQDASIVGLPKMLPSAAGFLLQKEVKIITKKAKKAKRPLVFIIGGAKTATKIPFIKALVQKADAVLVGGVLANTILAAQGIAVGKSVIDEKIVRSSWGLELTNPKLHLPVDVVVSPNFSGKQPIEVRPVGRVGKENIILDIGPDTQLLFEAIIQRGATLVWNGPMGLAEIKKFAQGTEAVFQAFIRTKRAYKIIGGGDTIALLTKKGMFKKVNFVSTGGGSLLQLFAGEKLPGIEALRVKQ